MNLIDLLDLAEQIKNQPTYDAAERGQRNGALRGIDDFFDVNLGTKAGPVIGAVYGAAPANQMRYYGETRYPLMHNDYGAYVGALHGNSAVNRAKQDPVLANSVPQMGSNAPIKPNMQSILNAFIR